jgi:hypothetical protein
VDTKQEVTRAMREELAAKHQLQAAGYTVAIYELEDLPIHVYNTLSGETGRFWTIIAAWRWWQIYKKIW